MEGLPQSLGMLVYSEHTSPRLSYVLDMIGQELTGTPMPHTTNAEAFRAYDGVRIQYGGHRLAATGFYLPAMPVLFENGVRDQPANCFLFEGHTAFFPGTGDLPFDMFAGIFFLLSRYEEYLPHRPDSYGRYPHTESLAWRERFLGVPVVNFWLLRFRERLLALYPNLTLRHPAFEFIPTYDIDMAWSFRGKGFFRNAAGFLRSVLTADPGRFAARWRTLTGGKPDPFDAYEWLDALHLYCRVHPWYFFLLARRRGKWDKNISPASRPFQALVRYHAAGYRTGIHPSFRSGDSDELLAGEIATLAALTSRPVKASRQHYLRLSMPVTYRRLLAAGIRHDFSLGYGSANGFRASFAGSFYWYDLEAEAQTPLLLTPFCFMDTAARFGEKADPRQALDEMMRLYRVAREVNGQMVTLWHNHFLGSDPAFAGWKEVYAIFLREEIFWDS